MKKIIFIPTWRCQLNCSYCDYGYIDLAKTNGYTLQAFDKQVEIGRELYWVEWLEYLDRFEGSGYLLEMTGGEPTCYKDLPKLLRHIGHNSKWAITSNTLNSDIIKEMPLHNCLAWTASYHFHSDKEFERNLFNIKRRGIMPRVTIVFTPWNYEEAFKKIKHFAQNFGVNIHPMLKQGFSWEKSGYMRVWREAEQLARDIDSVQFINSISDEWKPERYDVCSAGRDYFCVMPDGQVRRCYSHLLAEKVEGHIKDFKPATEARPCGVDCMFPCDRDEARKGLR